jgi:hypothetical protein
MGYGFNSTFNNITAISCRSVLMVYPAKTTDMPQVTDELLHNAASSTLAMRRI